MDHDRASTAVGDDHGTFGYQRDVLETGRISNGPRGTSPVGFVAGTTHRLVKYVFEFCVQTREMD